MRNLITNANNKIFLQLFNILISEFVSVTNKNRALGAVSVRRQLLRSCVVLLRLESPKHRSNQTPTNKRSEQKFNFGLCESTSHRKWLYHRITNSCRGLAFCQAHQEIVSSTLLILHVFICFIRHATADVSYLLLLLLPNLLL